MKAVFLVGLFSMVAPAASASETTVECQVDETRRASATRTQPQAPAQIADPAAIAQQRAEAPRRGEPARRRDGKPVPDAELIGRRAVL